MLRIRRFDILYLFFPLIAVGKAQAVKNILARNPILLAAPTPHPADDAFSTAITTRPTVSSLATQWSPAIRAALSTSSPDPTSPVQSSDPDTTIPPTSVPMIAGSLAGFMVILACVLVCVVIQRKKRQRRNNQAIHRPVTRARVSIPSSANSLPVHSRKTGSVGSSVVPPSPDFDLSSLPGTKSSKRNTVLREQYEPRNPQYPPRRAIVTEGQSYVSPDNARHFPTTSPSTAVSSATLNTDRFSEIKPTIIPTDTSSESYSHSISPSSTAFSDLSPQYEHPLSITTPSSIKQVHPHPHPHAPAHTESLSLSYPPIHDPQRNRRDRQPPSVPPEVRRQNLIALLEQQRDALQSQGNEDTDPLSATALLNEQIQALRQHDQSLTQNNAPPAYER